MSTSRFMILVDFPCHFRRAVFRLALFVLTVLGLSAPLQAQSFFDDFEDGNLTDGMPASWNTVTSGGTVTASNGDLVLTSTTGQCCLGSETEFAHDDIAIEAVFGFPEDDRIFVGLGFRDVLDGVDNTYWAGAFPTGEIGVGYTAAGSGIQTAQRGVFLPSGPIAAGTDVTFDLKMIGNEMTFSAWETALGPESSASITWTDTANRYPSGDIFSPFINPNGSLESVYVRSFGATVVPEPSSNLLLLLACGAGIVRRRRK
jgi:hypothetical protein